MFQAETVTKNKVISIAVQSSYVKFTESLTRMTWFLLSLWFVTTITDKHADDAQRPIYLRTHTNIYWHHLLCSHSSYLYYTEWIIFWRKSSLQRGPQCLYCLKITHVEVIHQLIGFNKIKSFLWNIKNTDGNGINGQNIHTLHPERKISLERVS